MSNFISACMCKGIRPKQFSIARPHLRSDAISRLMRERNVLRCLIAPGGFGKSTLASEYADVVFSYEHVFWVDAQSPCFLRDLDKGTLGHDILKRDPAAALVVFDEIGSLDGPRAERLSTIVDELLAHSCEVIATMPPSADVFEGLQPDRVVLRATDLLLSEAEMQAHAFDSGGEGLSHRPLPRLKRIPIIAFGGEDRYSRLVCSFVKESLPADVQLGVFTMLAFKDGSFDDVSRLGIQLKQSTISFLSENYIFCGMDLDHGTFQALNVPVQALLDAFLPHLQKRASSAGFEGRDDFAWRACRLLVERGQAHRACELANAMLTCAARAQWLSSCGLPLFDELALVEAGDVYMSLRRERSALDARLQVAQAWRLAMLGDTAEALSITRRLQNASYAPSGTRAFAALLNVRFDAGDEARKAYAVLDELDGLRSELVLRDDEMPIGPDAEGDVLLWLPLVQIQRALPVDALQAVALWERWKALGAHPSAMLLAGAWITWAMKSKAPAGIMSDMRSAIERQSGEEGRVGMLAIIAEQAYRHACESGSKARSFSTQAQAALLKARELLHDQKARYRKNISEIEAPIRAYNALAAQHHAASPVAYGADEPDVPLLHVCLFGRFDVHVGERCIEESSFSRQKTKTLLALLALDAGREVPRDKLASSLWSCSNITSARKNLYTVWSALRRNLELSNGMCPYLVRLQNGFKLDKRFVESDVHSVESFCKSVLMGEVTERTWAPMLAQINEAYAGDLMPSETENDDLVRMRLSYRSRVVGALIAASAQLVAMREPRGALCYADAAFSRDNAREDVYVARMRAQIACNQRTQAMETYFACRRFLAEELGIDPSAELVDLYRSIIEEEAPLD